jgi:hypothetical protein
MVLASSTADTTSPGINSGWKSGSLLSLLDNAIFAFLAIFAVALPQSIKGAERAWKIAFLLWLIKLAFGRMRPLRQPLVAPVLAYAVLSAISSALSSEPYLSWDRMKFVCLYLAGIVIAQNVRKVSQVRWLVLLFVFSGMAAAIYTGWQYANGIGVRVLEIATTSQLYAEGIHPDDIITKVGGQRVRTPDQLVSAIRAIPPDEKVEVEFLRFLEVRPTTQTVVARDFLDAHLGTPAMRLAVGRPNRAQGTLGHYVVYAEILMQIGCMAWALLLITSRREIPWWLAFGVAIVAVTSALFMTGTRAALAGLVIGCMLSLLLLRKGILRWVAAATLIAVLAGATAWIQYSRRVQWVDDNDTSTHFRVLMWEDGLRLVKEHPWFGVGMETVRVHWREWNIRGFIQYHVQSHFHSTYLQIAVERGVPALLAWLWFCGAYAMFLAKLFQRLQGGDRFLMGVVSGIIGGFTAFSFTSFLHYNLGEESVAMALFFLWGLAIAIDRITRENAVLPQ